MVINKYLSNLYYSPAAVVTILWSGSHLWPSNLYEVARGAFSKGKVFPLQA